MNQARRIEEGVPWPPGRRYRPWLVALGLWLSLAAVTTAALWHLRRATLDSQARELGTLSLALTDAIERGLSGVDEGLRTMQAELREGRLPANGPDANESLHTRAALMPLVQTLWLLDATGRAVAASHELPPPELATFSPALHGLTAEDTALSRPFAGVDGHAAMVALAMPLRSGHGWIVAGMPASALLGAFGSALPAADARMWVLRSDGARLAGGNALGTTLDDAIVAQRLTNGPSLEMHRFSDGSDNLVGLHEVRRFGVKVVVARDLAAVLAPWRQSAEGAAVALALLLAIVAAAIYFVQRADRRRSLAQQALRTQLARSSKLESLGTLAGGVAHDFNNVLAGIVGFGEMAQDAAPQGSAQARHLDKVLRAAGRGKALVERILAFSRGGAKSSTVFSLEPVVEEVLTLLSASLRPGIVIERALEAPGAHLRGDPTQLFEVVMNLCTNAIQAMPAGGMLSIKLQREHVPAPRVLSHSALAAGDWLVLSVTDQGRGITADVMEHLFEPFFTTRSAQSGIGLGLAVVHGAVAEVGGAIDVQSRAGQGARFTLYLPESVDAVVAAAPAMPGAVGGAGQWILVVDDEPELVALAVETLEALGYRCVGYNDSIAALQALHDEPQRFSAVITDEVMPQMTGTQLTQTLRQRLPDLPVLLVSGYGGELLAQRAAAAGVTRVLLKPLRRADLSRALAGVLR
jgi:signal transduction histidine kinase